MRLIALIIALGLATTPAKAEIITSTLFGLAFAASFAGQLTTLAITIGVSVALSAAAAGLSYLISGGGQRQEQGSGEASGTLSSQSGVQVEERAGILERRRLYGSQVSGGGIFFQRTCGAGDAKNIYVLGFAVSDGICDALEAVFVGDVEVPLDRFGNPLLAPWYDVGGNRLKVSFRSGTDDQPVDPIIAARFPTPPDGFYDEDADRVSKWAEFRQRGVSTIVIEMHFGADADEHTLLWGAGGLPTLKFRVRGLRVFDPSDRNMDIADPNTWRWSDNATLIELDWLTAAMGFGVDPNEIDWDGVRESIEIDNRWIPTLAGRERRGRVNGIVVGSEANDSVLASMALQNRALVRRAFGQYSIRADRSAEPVMTIHQGLIVGPLSYQNEPDMRSAINRVVAEFSPASKANQSAQMTYEDADLIALDGQVLEQRLALRFCDSPAAAQRLGYAQIVENRVGRTLTGTFDISVLNAAGKANGQLLEAGDVVRVWFNVFQTLNGTYTVTGIEIAQDFTVTVALAGYDPAVIDGWGKQLETPFEDAA